MKTLQKFSSVHGQVHNNFNQERDLVTRSVYKRRRSAGGAPRGLNAASSGRVALGRGTASYFDAPTPQVGLSGNAGGRIRCALAAEPLARRDIARRRD
jgi:hypothetical protein